MDLNKPKGKMSEVASRFGVDLSDATVIEEFLRLRETNLNDIRIWLK
jgi:hypothetical protein